MPHPPGWPSAPPMAMRRMFSICSGGILDIMSMACFTMSGLLCTQQRPLDSSYASTSVQPAMAAWASCLHSCWQLRHGEAMEVEGIRIADMLHGRPTLLPHIDAHSNGNVAGHAGMSQARRACIMEAACAKSKPPPGAAAGTDGGAGADVEASAELPGWAVLPDTSAAPAGGQELQLSDLGFWGLSAGDQHRLSMHAHAHSSRSTPMSSSAVGTSTRLA